MSIIIDKISEVKFARPSKESFRKVLSKRINAYFKENEISSKGNTRMHLKTAGMLALYFVPYGLMLAFGTSPVFVIGMYLIMGFGMSGIGMSVMHDAIHGAYSKNKFVNKLMGATIYLISGNASTWRVQHNVLHHTFTNIEGLDEDMETSGLVRLHESQEWKPMHKFQHIYTPMVYSLLTLNWVISKDFKQLLRYYKAGFGDHNTHNITKEWVILVATKALYFSLFIVLPLLLTDVSWYWVILGFVSMHFLAGFVLSFVFQLAHMVEGVELKDIPEDGNMDEWMEHQLQTTSNFARKNRLVNWYVGGLNFQVEHHLFPNICHIHYPKISKIVEQTAKEFNIKYREFSTVSSAVGAHMRHLKEMSKKPSMA